MTKFEALNKIKDEMVLADVEIASLRTTVQELRVQLRDLVARERLVRVQLRDLVARERLVECANVNLRATAQAGWNGQPVTLDAARTAHAEYGAMFNNLRAVQEQCTALLEEVRPFRQMRPLLGEGWRLDTWSTRGDGLHATTTITWLVQQ